MRKKIGFVLLLIIIFSASYLRPQQQGAPGDQPAYTYQQIVGALADAGLEPSIAVAGTAGARSLGVPAREHHRLTIGQSGMEIFILGDGDAASSSEEGLRIERQDGSALEIPATAVGERYAMHRANVLILLDSIDSSEIAYIIEALARLP